MLTRRSEMMEKLGQVSEYPISGILAAGERSKYFNH